MNEAGASRVVVWLDPAAPQGGLQEVLAGLGAGQEILGLFIEDINLLEMSRLQVAREFTVDTPAARALNPSDIERRFLSDATRMQKLFEAAVRSVAGRHTFQVARGEPGAELIRVSARSDMLVIAHSRHQLAPRLTLRARLEELLESGPPKLLFVQEQWRTGQCIAVLFDGSAASEAALRTAASLALAGELHLSVWLPAADPEARDELAARCNEMLGQALPRSFLALNDHDSNGLVRAAATSNARALVLPATETTGMRQLVTELLERVNCSVIVTR